MSARSVGVWLVVCVVGAGLCRVRALSAEEPAAGPKAGEHADEPLPMPRGVEVLTRGPVHEAFARPVGEPAAPPRVPKRPPKPLEELPPDQKPAGNAVWIGGYWAWDQDRKDFLWVSGVWRVSPPGKRWVAGYWREDGEQAQWVPGFWTGVTDATAGSQEMNYLPAPPAQPPVAPPGDPPTADSFYAPGYWVWSDGRYAWRAGYWAHVEPGHVWVPPSYSWTPGGCVFVPGYWDWTAPERGVLYAPVAINAAVVGPAFVYTPCYVVCDPIFSDWLFVGPGCTYFFGDYYGAVWFGCGFCPCCVYGCRCYDPFFAHACWEHRHNPHWREEQLKRHHEREAGKGDRPPRTFAEQNAHARRDSPGVKADGGHGNQVVAPHWQQAAARNTALTPLDASQRAEARHTAEALHQAGLERRQVEVPGAHGEAVQPHAARLNVPELRGAEAPREPRGPDAGAFPGRGPAGMREPFGRYPGGPGPFSGPGRWGPPGGGHFSGGGAGSHPSGAGGSPRH
jgi:hypothetical protein